MSFNEQQLDELALRLLRCIVETTGQKTFTGGQIMCPAQTDPSWTFTAGNIALNHALKRDWAIEVPNSNTYMVKLLSPQG
ncbi:hypothetical protein [Burkholderia ubonensis]|uniref:hypothetical protein n=1 Tax=Burkholderia ubonensis TaxID=101571 RepID=UPI000B0B60F3|nr:hypothetical protein [Burkholderia ubonensis]